jgi:hypothetical protein
VSPVRYELGFYISEDGILQPGDCSKAALTITAELI